MKTSRIVIALVLALAGLASAGYLYLTAQTLDNRGS